MTHDMPSWRPYGTPWNQYLELPDSRVFFSLCASPWDFEDKHYVLEIKSEECHASANCSEDGNFKINPGNKEMFLEYLDIIENAPKFNPKLRSALEIMLEHIKTSGDRTEIFDDESPRVYDDFSPGDFKTASF